jgi:dynein heavy chain
LNDPWEELDAVDLENTVDNAVKTMGQVLRYFKDKELPQILKIATEMKANVDKFKPYVPLAVSLRKEGMYERHWD